MNRRKLDVNADGEETEGQIDLSEIKPWYNSRVLSILAISWVIFSTLLGLLTVVIFVQAHWLGTSKEYFGLFTQCSEKDGSTNCYGSLSNFSEIISGEWKAATILVLFAFLIEFSAVFIFVVYWCKHEDKSFLLAWCCVLLQFFSGVLLLIACLLYPAGWGTDPVRAVCGASVVAYDRGHCDPQWAYGLAWLCAADSLILSILLGCFIERQNRGDRAGNANRNGTRALALANGSVNRQRVHSPPPHVAVVENNHTDHIDQTTDDDNRFEDTMM